jgi:large subunit ribosomal protein L9
MSHVEVLLRERVEGLGRCGDVVRVRPGFARNFLLPRRLAVAATEENKRAMQRRRVRLDVEEAARKAEIDARVAALSAVRVVAHGRADEGGHLYGSVNAAAIAALLAAAGHPFEEQDVRLDLPLRTVGEHAVRLHVHGDRYATITVAIEPEGASTSEA